MDQTSLAYYAERERRQLALAARASDPAVAEIHRNLAGRYRAIIVDGTAPMLPA